MSQLKVQSKLTCVLMEAQISINKKMINLKEINNKNTDLFRAFEASKAEIQVTDNLLFVLKLYFMKELS